MIKTKDEIRRYIRQDMEMNGIELGGKDLAEDSCKS